MKHFRSFATFIVVAGAVCLVSCDAGKEEKAAEISIDSTVVAPAVPAVIPAGPSSLMIVRHKVADYSKWKSGYDSHDSSRLASGLHSYVVARGTEDSNVVLIAVKMDDVEKAKAFAASKDLKDKMKNLGVAGAPVIDFIETVSNDTTALLQTTRVMVRHKIKDWDAWKKSFDENKQARTDAGISDRAIGHTIGDNHEVTLVFAVLDLEKAKAFMKSQELKDKMKEAGVDGPPDFFYYKVVQRY